MWRIRTGLAVVALLLAMGGSARAQGFVIGGWGPGVYWQGYNGPGFYGGYSYAPWGMAYAPYGYGAYRPYYRPYSTAYGYSYGYVPPPLTYNATGPLMQSILRSTGRPYSWQW